MSFYVIKKFTLAFYVKKTNVKRSLNAYSLQKKRWIIHIKVPMVYVNITIKIIDIVNPMILKAYIL